MGIGSDTRRVLPAENVKMGKAHKNCLSHIAILRTIVEFATVATASIEDQFLLYPGELVAIQKYDDLSSTSYAKN